MIEVQGLSKHFGGLIAVNNVSLKIMPAVRDPDVGLRPEGEARRLFAHLQLRAEPTGPDPLIASPTLRALACAGGSTHSRLAATGIVSPATIARC